MMESWENKAFRRSATYDYILATVFVQKQRIIRQGRPLLTMSIPFSLSFL